jgi:hypothetical protein
VPRTVRGLKKRFTMPYWHDPMCLPCLEGMTRSGTKHERAVPCRHGTTQVPPLIRPGSIIAFVVPQWCVSSPSSLASSLVVRVIYRILDLMVRKAMSKSKRKQSVCSSSSSPFSASGLQRLVVWVHALAHGKSCKDKEREVPPPYITRFATCDAVCWPWRATCDTLAIYIQIHYISPCYISLVLTRRGRAEQ